MMGISIRTPSTRCLIFTCKIPVKFAIKSALAWKTGSQMASMLKPRHNRFYALRRVNTATARASCNTVKSNTTIAELGTVLAYMKRH
jgi:hypothetical protein